jgi:DNA-binding FrmR family transcriptional regulator
LIPEGNRRDHDTVKFSGESKCSQIFGAGPTMRPNILLDPCRVPPYAVFESALMSHTVKDKAKLLARVRRIKGQAEAVERALNAELGCTDVLMLVASMRGAINGLTAELMEDHIRHHVVDPASEKDADRAKGAADLIEVVRTYLK